MLLFWDRYDAHVGMEFTNTASSLSITSVMHLQRNLSPVHNWRDAIHVLLFWIRIMLHKSRSAYFLLYTNNKCDHQYILGHQQHCHDATLLSLAWTIAVMLRARR
jgi:hypothetical protein